MTRLFIWHAMNSSVAVVPAVDLSDAWGKIARQLVIELSDSAIREHIDSFIINDGLFSEFFCDNKGHFMHTDGNLRKPLKGMSPAEQEAHINEWVSKNVRSYWQDKPEFAEEYLENFNEMRTQDANFTPNFSDEFYIDTFKRIVEEGNWYELYQLEEIPMDDSNDITMVYHD